MEIQRTFVRFRSITVLLFISSMLVTGSYSLLLAQPVAGKVSQDRLTFGTVFVGATIEASVRIFVKGKGITGFTVKKVEPPSFVQIKDTEFGTETYGASGTKTFYDIALSIDTRQQGNYSGSLQVQIDDQQVEIPVDVSVLTKEPGLTHVLVVETPFDKYSTTNASSFAPWLELVRKTGLDMHYWLVKTGQPVLRNKDLSEFDVILLAEHGLLLLSKSDIDCLKRFIEQGGRIILAASAFYYGTVAKANELLVTYGLQMTNVEPTNSNVELRNTEIADDPLTREIMLLKFFRPSPTLVLDQSKGKILVPASEYPGMGYVTVSRPGKGEVITLGVPLWWDWIDGENSDNARFLQNLLTKPRQQ